MRRTSRQLLPILLIVAVLLGIFVLMATSWPVGSDYFFYFYPTAFDVRNGLSRLYDNPRRFFNAPWTLALLVPLTYLEIPTGEAVLNVLSLVGIALSATLLVRRPPRFAFILIFVNLFTLDVLVRGNFDAFALFGIALGFYAIRDRRPLLLSVALAFIAVKPSNAILTVILFALAIRGWSLREIARVLVVPVVLSLLCMIPFGIDWPLRYLAYIRILQPDDFLAATIWKAAAQFNIPNAITVLVVFALIGAFLSVAGRRGFSLWSLSLSLATMFCVTVYANDSHYVLLTPALLYFVGRERRVFFAAYALMWLPLIRGYYGYNAAWIDLIYPIFLLIMLWRLPPEKSGMERVRV